MVDEMTNEIEPQLKIKRKVRFSVYAAMLSFTVLIFLLGGVIGNWIASEKASEVELNQQKLILQLNSFDLKSQIISGADICNASIDNILEERANLGANIESLESRIGKDNPEIIMQKEIYEMIELKTAVMLESYNQKCNKSNMIIYYFYTNKENDVLGKIAASEDQGYILNQFGRQHKESNVFSFDINLRNSAIDAIVNIYHIESVPALIINNKLNGYMTLDELESLANSSGQNS